MEALSKESLKFGEKLASITLGIDALDRRMHPELDDYDGLVVINMGWKDVTPFDSYEAARAALRELAKESFTLPEPDRRLYYLQACLSLDSFCAFSMGLMPDLCTQVGMFLHADCAPASKQTLDAYCDELRAMLVKMGYTGSLPEMCARWEEANRVPAKEVKQTMLDLMAVAREKCGKFMELPEALYGCEVEEGGPFSARSEYDHLRVVVNIEPTYTRQALKHLVCHEAYPGHYMQFTYRKVLWERGLAAADGLLSVCNHSSSSTFEGIADMGIHFLDWIEDDNDRVYKLLGTIKSAMGTSSSYQYHTLHWDKERIREWMLPYALVGGEGAIKSRLRFIEDPSRAALIWSYWRGDQAVEGVYNRVADADRQRFYDYIYGRLHTPASLQLFH